MKLFGETDDETLDVPSPYQAGGLEIKITSASKTREAYVFHVTLSSKKYEWYVPVVYTGESTLAQQPILVWGKSTSDPEVIKNAAKEKVEEITRTPTFTDSVNITESKVLYRILNRLTKPLA